jgi:hypothetical protein
LHFIHGIRPSVVQAYGETAAKLCKEEGVLHANIFIGRLLSMFPGEGKRRLVPTLAYQLAISPFAPEELKIEILRALFLEPDIPQHNLANQFEKLIVRPLQNVRSLLPPVVFVLDSVHKIYYDGIRDVIEELVQALDLLHQKGVDAKAVITGVGYHGIIKTFQRSTTIEISRMYPIPLTNPLSLLSIARKSRFRFLDWMYSRSWPVQVIVGVGLLCFSQLCILFLSAVIFVIILSVPLSLPGYLGVLFVFTGVIFLFFLLFASGVWMTRLAVQLRSPRRFDS